MEIKGIRDNQLAQMLDLILNAPNGEITEMLEGCLRAAFRLGYLECMIDQGNIALGADR